MDFLAAYAVVISLEVALRGWSYLMSAEAAHPNVPSDAQPIRDLTHEQALGTPILKKHHELQLEEHDALLEQIFACKHRAACRRRDCSPCLAVLARELKEKGVL